MKTPSRTGDDHGHEIQQVRKALGAVAVGDSAVFWVFMNRSAQWCLRREGASGELKFDSQRMCLDRLNSELVRCASYRLFVQGSDGPIDSESFNRH